MGSPEINSELAGISLNKNIDILGAI